jgi:ribosome-associated protein
VSAIADGIERALRDRGVRPLHTEGAASAHWVLLDYGDFVVHVFDPETRGYYGLERLWADAPDVTAELRG